MPYTSFNINTHVITGRYKSNVSLQTLSADEDWLEGDWDDQIYNIAPAADEESAPTPYLKPNAFSQTDLRTYITRKRKMLQAAGFDFDFASIPGGNPSDPRGIHRIGTTKADLEGWDEVTKYADLLEKMGQPNAMIDIDTDTGPVQIEAWEWKYVLLASGQFRQPLWKRASELTYMDPIPQEVMIDDAFWDVTQPIPT